MTFVTGPAEVPPPLGVQVVRVQTAAEMLTAVNFLEAIEIAVFAAAVADWRVAAVSNRKIKKDGGTPTALTLAENPDILATVAQREKDRPKLVVGFAAETDDVIAHAAAKRLRKGCDWIVANDVSPGTGIMGGAENAVTLITAEGAEEWSRMSKVAVAERLAARVVAALGKEP